MGEVGSARYEPALLPPCPSIRVLCYSNCQEIHPLTPADRLGSVSVKDVSLLLRILCSYIHFLHKSTHTSHLYISKHLGLNFCGVKFVFTVYDVKLCCRLDWMEVILKVHGQTLISCSHDLVTAAAFLATNRSHLINSRKCNLPVIKHLTNNCNLPDYHIIYLITGLTAHFVWALGLV